MHMEDLTVGQRIKVLREEKEYTQKDLAAKLSIKRTKIADWERDRQKLNINDIIDLSNILDTSCDMILRGISPENLRLNKDLGLSDVAIKVLKDFHESKCWNEPDGIYFGSLISYLIENLDYDQIVTTFINYNASFRRSIVSQYKNKEESKERHEEFLKHKKWADENGFVEIEPISALNYYINKMANIFALAIEEGVKGKEKFERRCLELIDRQKCKTKNKEED